MGSYLTKPTGSGDSSLDKSYASTSSDDSSEEHSTSRYSSPETDDLDSPMEEFIASFQGQGHISQASFTFSANGSGRFVDPSLDTSGSVSIVLEITDHGEYRHSKRSEQPVDPGLEEVSAGDGVVENLESTRERSVYGSAGPSTSTVIDAGVSDGSIVSEPGICSAVDGASAGVAVFDEETWSMSEQSLATISAPSTMIDIPRKEKRSYKIKQDVYVKAYSNVGHYWYPGKIMKIGVANYEPLDSRTWITGVCYTIKYTYKDGEQTAFYKSKKSTECLFADDLLPDTVDTRKKVIKENKAFERKREKKNNASNNAQSSASGKRHKKKENGMKKRATRGSKVRKG